MSLPISVIICTYNPRRDYLERTLKALQAQTLGKTEWELILIDNASKDSLAAEIDLTWHPKSHHFREDALGLTPARLRGMSETQGDILIFVDDDNVLDADYLEVAHDIAAKYPNIGAWSGQIDVEFETPPPEPVKELSNFFIRRVERDKWGNTYSDETIPIGAGLCVRRSVAEEYSSVLARDTLRKNLDRKGTSLVSGGDTDIAFTACDIGFGTGVFAGLKLTHLIPASRLKEEYLWRMFEGISYSATLLEHLRPGAPKSQHKVKRKALDLLGFLLMDRSHKRAFLARQRGKKKALQILTQTSSSMTD